MYDNNKLDSTQFCIRSHCWPFYCECLLNLTRIERTGKLDCDIQRSSVLVYCSSHIDVTCDVLPLPHIEHTKFVTARIFCWRCSRVNLTIKLAWTQKLNAAHAIVALQLKNIVFVLLLCSSTLAASSNKTTQYHRFL